MKSILLLLLPFLCACESMPKLSDREKAWQVLHAVDVLQTYQIPKDENYIEGDPFTSKIISHNPSEEQVILWGIGSSVAHYYLMKKMDKSKLPKWVKNFVWTFDFSYKGTTVYNNHRIGIRINGNNRPE